MSQIRVKCLEPGLYYKNLKHWFMYFSLKQLIMVDGKFFRENPTESLMSLQTKLGLSHKIDYSKILRFNRKKGFYCYTELNNTKCLGKSKGRKYQKLDIMTRAYLENFFNQSNYEFFKFLKRKLKYFQIPKWLVVW